MKEVIKLIVVNARSFPEIGVHMWQGYTTAKTYAAAYNEVLGEIAKISTNAEIETIYMTKGIESNVTGLTFSGFHVTVKFKE